MEVLRFSLFIVRPTHNGNRKEQLLITVELTALCPDIATILHVPQIFICWFHLRRHINYVCILSIMALASLYCSSYYASCQCLFHCLPGTTEYIMLHVGTSILTPTCDVRGAACPYPNNICTLLVALLHLVFEEVQKSKLWILPCLRSNSSDSHCNDDMYMHSTGSSSSSIIYHQLLNNKTWWMDECEVEISQNHGMGTLLDILNRWNNRTVYM